MFVFGTYLLSSQMQEYVKFIRGSKILLLRAVPVKTSQSIALRCTNLMRIPVPLTNASLVFKFLIRKTMQLTFNTNLCGGKPLIAKEFCISLRRFFFIYNLNKLPLGADFTAGIKHRR
jgi:hypothetical protein